MIDIEDVDPEEFVQEHRERIIRVIRHSDDPFTRACAWTLLDRYTRDEDLKQLHDELDAVAEREDDT